jgi:hypothetical protein
VTSTAALSLSLSLLLFKFILEYRTYIVCRGLTLGDLMGVIQAFYQKLGKSLLKWSSFVYYQHSFEYSD